MLGVRHLEAEPVAINARTRAAFAGVDFTQPPQASS
jgi:hypothetical protein